MLLCNDGVFCGMFCQGLMNKVLRDTPEEPLIYLLRCLYKKAGMEIPQVSRCSFNGILGWDLAERSERCTSMPKVAGSNPSRGRHWTLNKKFKFKMSWQ
jgi:hypothetical protein